MPNITSGTYSGFVSKTYASISADTVMVTERPGYDLDGGDRAEIYPRRVRVETAGDNKFEYHNGETDTIAFTNFDKEDIQFAKIINTGTTATNITVIW